MHFIIKNRYHLRVKRWRKIFQQNGPRKHSIVATLLSDKGDFNPKLIQRGREGRNIVLLNNYALNTKAPKLIREILLELTSHIDPHTMKADDFSTVLLPANRSPRQKLNRKYWR